MLIASWQSEEYFVIERDIKNVTENNYGPIYVEKRRVSLWEYGLFVIGFEGGLDEDTDESLIELCREEKCLFLQVETINYSGEQSWEGSKYYKKFIPPYTALIDLILWEEEILKAMKPKGRYNIKLARKKWVVVEQVEKHMGNIKKFHELMSETTTRNKFAGNTLEYYKIFLESLENSQLMFAYHEGDIVAAGIFVVQDDVMTYYYGASTNGEKRKYMPTYLLQWTAIEHAIKRWCKIYDFLGVAGDNEINSSLAGVTDFKMKLSPSKTLISRSSMYVNKTLKYNPYSECSQDNWPQLCTPPMEETYSNKCMMDAAGATFLYKWECWDQNKKPVLPKDTDTKYYVWDTNKCMIIKYGCDDWWNGFSDEIWCGCKKKQWLSEEQKMRIDIILSSFFTNLVDKSYPEEKVANIVWLAMNRFEALLDSKPEYNMIILYTIEELKTYKQKYYYPFK